MKSMLKRNDGYALSYVLVVLLVLAAIALAVMTLSLNAVKRQQASIDQMKDKYVAQGMVEQVVAQLENAKNEADILGIVANYNSDTANPSCKDEPVDGKTFYKVIAREGTQTVTVVTAIFELEADYGENNTNDPSPILEDESGNIPESGESQSPIGYNVIYHSYKTELISAEGGAEE